MSIRQQDYTPDPGTLRPLKNANGCKRVKAADLLIETGLLFEINRQLLHPLGMALACVQGEDGDMGLAQFLLKTDKPGGMVFTPDAYQEGAGKFDNFMHEMGHDTLNRRFEATKVVVQCSAEHGIDLNPTCDPKIPQRANDLRGKVDADHSVYTAPPHSQEASEGHRE